MNEVELRMADDWKKSLNKATKQVDAWPNWKKAAAGIPVRCKLCGSNGCICEDDQSLKWAAHCMTCDQSIGEPGYYHAVADSEKQAVEMWNKLNME